jgi:hypothetical protein
MTTGFWLASAASQNAGGVNVFGLSSPDFSRSAMEVGTKNVSKRNGNTFPTGLLRDQQLGVPELI